MTLVGYEYIEIDDFTKLLKILYSDQIEKGGSLVAFFIKKDVLFEMEKVSISLANGDVAFEFKN